MSDMHGDEEVIVKKINNFEEFGFSGDFEGEILKQFDNRYIGYFINKCNYPIECHWDSNGNSFIGLISNSIYNLTRTKKEWYELEENIGRLLTDGSTFISFDKAYFDKWDGSLVGYGYRLATNEEIDALKTKDN